MSETIHGILNALRQERRVKKLKQRISELESVLQEALDANQFNSHGWVHRAITLLESSQ